jgi:hypothetical protein
MATTLGLIIGVPLSLWVNRRIILYSENLKDKEKKQRLSIALQTLIQSLNENIQRLDDIAHILQLERLKLGFILDTSAWEAVKPEVIQYLHEPNLQGKIAYHFAKLSSFEKLNLLYQDYNIGILSSIMETQEVKASLKATLIGQASNLSSEAKEIIEGIKSAKKLI